MTTQLLSRSRETERRSYMCSTLWQIGAAQQCASLVLRWPDTSRSGTRSPPRAQACRRAMDSASRRDPLLAGTSKPPSRIGMGRLAAASSPAIEPAMQQQLLSSAQRATPTALPRFSATLSRDQAVATKSSPRPGSTPSSSTPSKARPAARAPCRTGASACTTPVLKFSAQAMPAPSMGDGSSSKWKAADGPVFSVVTRGSRQPAPAKAHSTAARMRQAQGACAAARSSAHVQARGSAGSMNMRSSAQGTPTPSARRSCMGSASSCATPVNSGRPGSSRGGASSAMLSSVSPLSSRPASSSAKSCLSVARVLRFDDVSTGDQGVASAATPLPCCAGSWSGAGHNSAPDDAPAPAALAVPGTAAGAASAASPGRAGVAATAAAPRAAWGLDQMMLGLQPEDSSTTWLSDGSSPDEALQLMAAGTCLLSSTAAQEPGDSAAAPAGGDQAGTDAGKPCAAATAAATGRTPADAPATATDDQGSCARAGSIRVSCGGRRVTTAVALGALLLLVALIAVPSMLLQEEPLPPQEGAGMLIDYFVDDWLPASMIAGRRFAGGV